MILVYIRHVLFQDISNKNHVIRQVVNKSEAFSFVKKKQVGIPVGQ
jgi:hypothetical protein